MALSLRSIRERAYEDPKVISNTSLPEGVTEEIIEEIFNGTSVGFINLLIGRGRPAKQRAAVFIVESNFLAPSQWRALQGELLARKVTPQSNDPDLAIPTVLKIVTYQSDLEKNLRGLFGLSQRGDAHGLGDTIDLEG